MIADRLVEAASSRPRRIAFADAADPRVQTAARWCAQRGICHPVLVTGSSQLDESALDDLAADGVHALHVHNCEQRTYEHIMQRRSGKGLAAEDARLLAADPLYAAGTLLADARVDGAVAGALSSTPDVVRAALWTVGMAADTSVVSSFFLMAWPDKHLFFSDCGVVPEPSSEQLADIAWSAAENYRRLVGDEPRVAFLSFSTRGSAAHPSVDRVRTAYDRFHAKHPNVSADGELQFDAAFVPDVARRKAPDSPLTGTANVMIFPDLNAGN
ncbi:MAG: phosphate acetyltransferase, partial [Candidatus Kapabacteria bacterium]|nr:phosphate acetyltransferase [Candidatus Kapabacteria bacterium]